MFFSTNHGGIAPRCHRRAVRSFMERAQGLASSYVRSDIGATEFGRWHLWQLLCKIGAISFVNVTSLEGVAGAWAIVRTLARTSTPAGKLSSHKMRDRRSLAITTSCFSSRELPVTTRTEARRNPVCPQTRTLHPEPIELPI